MPLVLTSTCWQWASCSSLCARQHRASVVTKQVNSELTRKRPGRVKTSVSSPLMHLGMLCFCFACHLLVLLFKMWEKDSAPPIRYRRLCSAAASNFLAEVKLRMLRQNTMYILYSQIDNIVHTGRQHINASTSNYPDNFSIYMSLS